jgi:predicted DsbA family dithiol-disulfide isomerase
MAAVHITYYLEILSSWCTHVEPAWSALQERYAGKVDFAWKIALMNRRDFPASTAQCDWFYRRSGILQRHPQPLNSGWFEAKRKGNYEAPNLVAEAGRDFGLTDDRLRRALAHAALREGRTVGDLDTAVAIAAQAFGLDARALRQAAASKPVRARVAASTAEFHAHQLAVRPAFVLTNAIGDKAVFSGLTRLEPLAAGLDALLADAEGYQSFAAHFGPVPAK